MVLQIPRLDAAAYRQPGAVAAALQAAGAVVIGGLAPPPRRDALRVELAPFFAATPTMVGGIAKLPSSRSVCEPPRLWASLRFGSLNSLSQREAGAGEFYAGDTKRIPNVLSSEPPSRLASDWSHIVTGNVLSVFCPPPPPPPPA
jgi:hypothetical protein